MYDEYIKEEFKCKTSDELLGKKYVIGKQFGVGDYSRMKIEDGLEISKFNMYSANMYFDNRGYEDDVLEIGYCYSGTTKILAFPSNKKYLLKEGQIFFIKH